MGDSNERDLSTEAMYDEMEVLEPYTTEELASWFDAPARRIRFLLDQLTDAGSIRRKDPHSDTVIWIRSHRRTSVTPAGTGTKSNSFTPCSLPSGTVPGVGTSYDREDHPMIRNRVGRTGDVGVFPEPETTQGVPVGPHTTHR